MSKTLPGIKGKIKDLVGQQFGRLTVIAMSDRIKSGKNTKIRWKCLCSCGQEIIVRGDGLVSGNSKSCGCINKERLKNRMTLAKKNPQKQGLKEQLYKYKWEANNRNLLWNLSDEDAIDLFSQPCFYCDSDPVKRKFQFGEYWSNGIDRKDNSLGYTKENAVPCCTRCNLAKSSLNIKEFYIWLSKVSCSGPVRPFYLYRKVDVSRTSGTGIVAVGAIMPSGRAILEWLGEHKTETVFESIEQLYNIHSHEGKTVVVHGNPKFHHILTINNMLDVLEKPTQQKEKENEKK